MVQVSDRIWVGGPHEGPRLIGVGATRLIDLGARAVGVPGVPMEHFPLEDSPGVRHALLETAARRVSMLAARGDIVGIYGGGTDLAWAVAVASQIHDGQTLADVQARLPVRVREGLADGEPGDMVRQLEAAWRTDPVEHHVVGVGSLFLHAVHRPGPGASILLLHGAYGSWTHWRHNMAGLSQFLDVWALDLPGFGESDDWPGRFRHGDYRDAVGAAIRTMVPNLAVLGGYSFGAYLAAALLRADPHLARAGVLVALTGRTGDPKSHRRVEERHFPPHPSRQERLDVVADNLRRIHLADPQAADAATVSLTYHNILRTRLGYTRLSEGGPRDPALAVLAQVDVPLLLVWGAHDPFCQPTVAAWAEACHAANPSAECVVLNEAAHWCQYERPAGFDAAVRTFHGERMPGVPVH